MSGLRDIDVVVFDVLGTLVDETGGLRAAIGAAAPGGDTGDVGELVALWYAHLAEQHRRMAAGERAYATTDVVDAEAARLVADRAGVTDPAAVARLATAARRAAPFAGAVAGLARLAERLPVVALSNASTAALLRLHAGSGLRWHLVLSGETVRAYKPEPAPYRMAIEAAGVSPERVLMVAAHAWDLRGAQAQGMRTAYVDRPYADPPVAGDTFDGVFDGPGGFDALVTAVTGTATP